MTKSDFLGLNVFEYEDEFDVMNHNENFKLLEDGIEGLDKYFVKTNNNGIVLNMSNFTSSKIFYNGLISSDNKIIAINSNTVRSINLIGYNNTMSAGKNIGIFGSDNSLTNFNSATGSDNIIVGNSNTLSNVDNIFVFGIGNNVKKAIFQTEDTMTVLLGKNNVLDNNIKETAYNAVAGNGIIGDLNNISRIRGYGSVIGYKNTVTGSRVDDTGFLISDYVIFGNSNSIISTGIVPKGFTSIVYMQYNYTLGYTNKLTDTMYSVCLGLNSDVTNSSNMFVFGRSNKINDSTKSILIGYCSKTIENTDINNTSIIGIDNKGTSIKQSSVIGYTNTISNVTNSSIIGAKNTVSFDSAKFNINLFGTSNNITNSETITTFGTANNILESGHSHTIGEGNSLNNNGDYIHVLGTLNTISDSEVSEISGFKNTVNNIKESVVIGSSNIFKSTTEQSQYSTIVGSNNKLENIKNLRVSIFGSFNEYQNGGTDIVLLGNSNKQDGGKSDAHSNILCTGYYNKFLNSNQIIIGFMNRNKMTNSDIISDEYNTLIGFRNNGGYSGSGYSNTNLPDMCNNILIGRDNDTLVHNSYSTITKNISRNNTLIGMYNEVRDISECVVLGLNNKVAVGNLASTSYGSILIGTTNSDSRGGCIAIGRELVCSAANQIRIGRYNRNVSTYAFEVGVGSGPNDRRDCLGVEANGTVHASAYNSNGADYAEMFEWNNIPKTKDVRGLLVTLVGDKVELANDDDILGIIAGNSSTVVGNIGDEWNGMYEKDIFGKITYDADGVPVKSKEYDETKEFIPRDKRPEWAKVGLLGQLVVVTDGTLNAGSYVTAKKGIATKSDTRTNVKVMRIIDDTHALVFIR